MVKKKEILFVMNNLHVGGAEKALISLLQVFDYEKYNVDLLLFKKEGLFLDQVPSNVNILEEPGNYKFFDMPFSQVLKENIFKNWKVIFRRIQFRLLTKNAKTEAESEQFGWKALSPTLDSLNKNYDTAIGFLEKNPNYFVVEKVMANKKIGWIHNDYKSLGLNRNVDGHFFKKMHKIITISEECLNTLKKTFPELSYKFLYLQNIVSKNTISKLALQENPYGNEKTIKILSIGRLEEQKKISRSLDAAKILSMCGYKFRWDILGEGILRKDLEQKIQQDNLAEYVFLHGLEPNPYKYLANCDIFVQSSDFEGKSIAVDEAKILNTVILLTNYPTAKDQIKHMQNGFICERNAEALAKSLELLIKDESLRLKLSENLSKNNWGTENEIEKLYKLI